MTEVRTRGIATANHNLNHYRSRSRGGALGEGAAFLPLFLDQTEAQASEKIFLTLPPPP